MSRNIGRTMNCVLCGGRLEDTKDQNVLYCKNEGVLIRNPLEHKPSWGSDAS